jgi:WD40 repeat protein
VRKLCETYPGDPHTRPQRIAWLDGGKYLILVTSNRFEIWDVVAQKLFHTQQDSGHHAQFLAVHPNGKQFATADYYDPRCGRTSPARLWTLTPAGLKSSPLPLSGFHGGLAFTPDGSALVGGAACQNPAPKQHVGEIVWWDLQRDKKGVGFAGHAGLAGALAFQADGTRLVSMGGDGYVRVWDVASRQEIGSRKVKCVTGSFALAPDGRSLAFVHNYSGGFTLLDPSAGKKLGKPREVVGDTKMVRQLAFSPKSDCLASVGMDGRLCFWTRDGEAKGAESPGPSCLDCVAFAPDGLSVAIADWVGNIFLCDVS